MRISLLGPVHVDDAPGTVNLAAKERSLLATLALRAGTIVSIDALIRSLWGDEPPSSARKTLQTYISNLRQAIGPDAISTHPSGYRLDVDPDDIDIHRFRALVRAADDALRDDSLALARRQLREALTLWRGGAFGDVASHTGLASEGVRLEEEHLSALEARIAADLAAGAHGELVGELETLVRDHPFRERLWGALMVALYRCGRQADALATYQRARRQLVNELGLEPGGELRRIEEAILNQDESLAGPPSVDVAIAAGTPSGILRSPVRYTRSSGGVSIAYQVAGDGPIDIFAIPGFVTHLDIWWNAPTDGLVRRLTSIGRLISFDKRGMGLSDRPDTIDPTDWLDDALAVLDAVGAKDVVVLGNSSGTPTAIRLASIHPQRVRALVVFAGGPRSLAGPGYEIGHDRELVEDFATELEHGWGSGVLIEAFAPSRANDLHVRDYWARYQQLAASPTAAMLSFWSAVEDDVVDLLPTIEAPTLVLHPERDLITPVAWGRFLAQRIPRAEFVGLDSDVHLICVSDVITEMADEIAAFVGRSVPEAAGDTREPVLVTVVSIQTKSTALRETAGVALARVGGRVQARPALTVIFDTPGKALRGVRALLRELPPHDAVVGPIGIGVQVGECFLTDVGYRGAAVDIAHRFAVHAEPEGEVLITATVRDLLSDAGIGLGPRHQIDSLPAFAVVA